MCIKLDFKLRQKMTCLCTTMFRMYFLTLYLVVNVHIFKIIGVDGFSKVYRCINGLCTK